MGVRSHEVTLHRAQEILELALLARAPNLPDPSWLRATTLGNLQQAASVLRSLVTEYRQRRAALQEVFTEVVLTLDLETLCVRFETVHKGLGRLKSAYRADKRLLATATRTGKVSRAAIARLQEALDWQKLTRELDRAEAEHAGILGDRYYQRDRTDFDAVVRAIDVAGRIVGLAGSELNAKVLGEQLALGGSPDPTLLSEAEQLKAELDRWRAEAKSLLGEHEGVLVRRQLSQLHQWCEATHTSAVGIAQVLDAIDRISARYLPLAAARAAAEARWRVDEIEREMHVRLEDDRRLLGQRYEGLSTDWSGLTDALDWTQRVRGLIGAVDELAAQRLLEATPSAVQLREATRALEKTQNALLQRFEETRADELSKDLGLSFRDSYELLDALADSIPDVEEWLAFLEAHERLNESGLERTVAHCVETRVGRDDVVGVIQKSVLKRWADLIIREDPRLKVLRASDRDQVVAEFRELDRKLVAAAAAGVIEACNGRHPRTTAGEAGIILREAEKKKKHMPIRLLLENAGSVAQVLKPCFMMSPLTVSQFLPPSLRFDCVIFDEASQVKPSDAINCIYRGQELIIAGDQKQLPPTSFFEAVDLDDEDEYEEGQFDEFESILDICKASGWLRSLPLLWHYRSRHEHLITFSNYQFYDGRLVTFPAQLELGPDVGIELFKVDGIYHRGGARDNPMEAHKVVERVFSHAEHHPKLSLGVVTFSEAQATAIEMQLEQQRKLRPDLDFYFDGDRLSGFFVKSLENVQGDERDIIIFSIGYGPDELGRFTQNFGPLNREGGWRRLNVAITRARLRVEIVSSVTSASFTQFAEIRSEGVRQLRTYLEFAERGLDALAIEIGRTGLDAESPFEEEVLRVIRSWGYAAEPQVGCAGYRLDIGVRPPSNPGVYALGVECDGLMYHSSKVARDRDRLRQEILERLGWRIHRIWGTAWYRDRDNEERRLKRAIEAALAGGNKPLEGSPNPAAARSQVVLEEVELDRPPEWAVLYEPVWPEIRQGYRGMPMYDASVREALKDAILVVVEGEGPVAEEVVLRRVRGAWGVERAGSRIRGAFDSAVKSLISRDLISRLNRSLWMPRQEVTEVRVPHEDDLDSRRDVDEVPGPELQLAIVKVVEDARSIAPDELTQRVARLFGWNRRGSDIARALDASVSRLLRSGRLVREGDRIRLVASGD